MRTPRVVVDSDADDCSPGGKIKGHPHGNSGLHQLRILLGTERNLRRAIHKVQALAVCIVEATSGEFDRTRSRSVRG